MKITKVMAQTNVEEELSQLSSMVDNPFNPEVTVVAVNLQKHTDENDHLHAGRLLRAIGYGGL